MKNILFKILTVLLLIIPLNCSAAPNLNPTYWISVDDTWEVAAWIDTGTMRFLKNDYDRKVFSWTCLNRKHDDVTVYSLIEYDLNRGQHRYLKEEAYNTYNQLIHWQEDISTWITPPYGSINYEINVMLHSIFLERE